ncbi:hypothetical protein K438DRAFT_2171574 [Mycena galopus ATCC 62051]|nr:hypothetical protein K438DRAFT_2171574 [Mycena galopus ATCC 62051]
MQQARPRDRTPLYPSPRTSWEREQSGEMALSGFFVTEGFKPTPRTKPSFSPRAAGLLLSFLAESPSDLRTSGACAPTLETWVDTKGDTAQWNPFRASQIPKFSLKSWNSFWLLFRDTVEAYPHLICHVRDLRLQTDGEQLAIVTSTVGQICNIPFRHLFNSSTVMQIRGGRNPAPRPVREVPTPDLHFSRFIFPKAKKMSIQDIRTGPTKKILDLQDLNLEWNLRQAADETGEES